MVAYLAAVLTSPACGASLHALKRRAGMGSLPNSAVIDADDESDRVQQRYIELMLNEARTRGTINGVTVRDDEHALHILMTVSSMLRSCALVVTVDTVLPGQCHHDSALALAASAHWYRQQKAQRVLNNKTIRAEMKAVKQPINVQRQMLTRSASAILHGRDQQPSNGICAPSLALPPTINAAGALPSWSMNVDVRVLHGVPLLRDWSRAERRLFERAIDIDDSDTCSHEYADACFKRVQWKVSRTFDLSQIILALL